jgi:hypothetical protein
MLTEGGGYFEHDIHIYMLVYCVADSNSDKECH